MNPMIRKELRQRMRERRAWILPTLYLGVLGGVVALTYYVSTEGSFESAFRPARDIQGSAIGAAVFLAVIMSQLALLMLLAPIFSAGAITIEKEQRTLAGLLTSLLTPFQIWAGKFTAAMMFLVLLLISSVPVLALCFSLGGVGWSDVAAAFGMTLAILASIGAIGLYCSSYFRRSVHSTAVCYAVVIAISVLTAIAAYMLASSWQARHPVTQAAQIQPNPPGYLMAPLYLNPFYALISVFAPREGKVPTWAKCLALFLAMTVLFSLLAIQNIKRRGEQA